ncbi:MAG: alanine racemase [Firmicutes bacterium]|nr:alanine racemase [Bacillota bacterium]
MNRYPCVVVNHEAIRHNAALVSKWCEGAGIRFCGVIKGGNGELSIIRDYVAGGASMLGSSRLAQLRRVREAGLTIENPNRADKGERIPTVLIRVPMLSEIDEVIELADYSLNSEMVTLKALNEAALKAGVKHKVVLMADLGDLREGYIDHNELVETAIVVENEMDGLILAGIGTNLGCYGSIMADENNMTQLADIAEYIEAKIGRELEIVSGGATSSLKPVLDGVMPAKINMLRIGAAILDGPLDDVRIFYGVEEMDEMRDDAFILKAQVIERKLKPTHPIGTLGVDAFGKKPVYIDRGIRERILLGVGRQDHGDIDDLVPCLEGAQIVGASGDHTIIDIEECSQKPVVGDIMEFKLKYSAIMRLTASEDVKRYDIG